MNLLIISLFPTGLPGSLSSRQAWNVIQSICVKLGQSRVFWKDV
jgi:hypothetical protein